MERWALCTPRPVRVARRDAPQLATAAALLGFVWSRTLLGARIHKSCQKEFIVELNTIYLNI